MAQELGAGLLYPPHGKPAVLVTTEAIVRELSDMAEVEIRDVAAWMSLAGYSIVYHADGRHGWALYSASRQ